MKGSAGGAPAGETAVRAVFLLNVCFAVGMNAMVPLFPIYRSELGLSDGDLTLVFAAYSFTIAPTLLLVGGISDAVGRKRVLGTAVAVCLTGAVCFATASSFPVLVIGRALQGLAGGLFWGTVSAYARELVPDGRKESAAFLVGASYTAALAIGAIASGVVASTTGSTSITWLADVVLLLIGAATLWPLPETVPRRAPASIRAPRLPEGHERAFLLALTPLTLVLTSLGSVSTALGPSILEELGADAGALSGVALATMLTLATLAQVPARHWPSERAAVAGCSSLLAGTVVNIASLSLGWLAPFWVGTALIGVGTGLALLGTLGVAQRMSTASNRAAVLAVFNFVLYIGLSFPTIGTGYLADEVGLRDAYVVLALVGAAVLAAVLGPGRHRLRPGLAEP
jgi:MFS family permease